MKEDVEIDEKDMLDLMKYAFLRLDGAWFIAAAEQVGVEVATDIDVKTWEMFSERLARRIVSTANLQGTFAQVLPKLMKIQNKILNMNTELEMFGENKAIHRVTDCEVWKMVQKVWTRETAPCHKVTQSSIRGLLKGAFPKSEFIISHNKKIPLGDPYCEVEIILKNSK